MLIKAIRTGNKVFGTKHEEVRKIVTVEGVKLTIVEADTWSSGEHPKDGEYIRGTWLIDPCVDPWPNIKRPTKADSDGDGA